MLTKPKTTPFEALELLTLYQFDNNTIGSLLSMLNCIYMYLYVSICIAIAHLYYYLCVLLYLCVFRCNSLTVDKSLTKIEKRMDYCPPALIVYTLVVYFNAIQPKPLFSLPHS